MSGGLPLDREWRGGRFVMKPEAFAARCARIVETMAGHEAHRELDLLTNEVLASLGYGEGIAIFEAAVREWHDASSPYPAEPIVGEA